jgi:hypothetical protein
MPHHNPLKRRGLQAYREARDIARAECFRTREVALWVAWRCPELWRQAGEAIELRLGVRPSPWTMQGGRLVEALRLAGVMDGPTAARAMAPFARFEAVRVAYAKQAPAWGVDAPLLTSNERQHYHAKTSSDDSRGGRVGRARRAGGGR